MNKGTRLFLVVLGILGLIGGGLLTSQFVTQELMQREVDKATMELSNLQVLSIGSKTMSLYVGFQISAPNVDLTVQAFQAQLLYQDEEIGTIHISEFQIEDTTQEVASYVNLTVSDESFPSFQRFISDYLNLEDLTLVFTGETQLTARAGLLEVSSLVQLNKPLDLQGGNGFQNMTIGNLAITNSTSSLSIDGILYIFNPTVANVVFQNLSLNLFYQQSFLGNLTIYDFQLLQGENKLSVEIFLNPEEPEIAQEVVNRFLSDLDTNLTITGFYSFTEQNLLLSTLRTIELTTVLEGQANITISVQQFAITGLTLQALNCTAVLAIENPTVLEGTLSHLSLDVFYQDSYLGTIEVDNITLKHGDNLVSLNLTLSHGDPSVLQQVAAEYLNGKDVHLQIKGSPTGNTLSSLLSGWAQEIILPSAGRFQLLISNLGVLGSTATSLNLSLDLSLFNPTLAQIDVPDLALNLIWKEANGSLGIISLPPLLLNYSWTNLTLYLSLTPSNSSLVADFILAYLSPAENVTVQLQSTTSNATILDAILSSSLFEFQLPQPSALDLTVITLEIVNATTNQLTVNLTISVQNPSATPVNITKLVFNATYQGEYLGNITLPTLTVLPGNHSYDFTVNFTVSNTTVLENLLTAYLQGKTVEIGLACIEAGTDILSQVIQHYVSAIQLPVYQLLPSVLNLTVVDSSNDTLTVEVYLSIVNPIDLPVTLNNASFDLYYQGVYIGNLTLNGTLVLGPGNTSFATVGMLVQKENTTILQTFLSDYLNNHLAPLSVTGYIISDFGGIVSELNLSLSMKVNLTGIEETLVTAITITQIVISLLPYSFTVYAQATILNPLPFNITILSMEYDLYFDDPDGATLGIFSYGPADNIFMGTISDNSAFNLTAEASINKTVTFTSSSTELTIRLNDEYNVKHDLKVDALNGVLVIKIGAFEIELHFELHDLPVD